MKTFFIILDGFILTFCGCCVGLMFMTKNPLFTLAFIPYIIINIIPSPVSFKTKSIRLHICSDGSDILMAFMIASLLCFFIHLFAAVIVFIAFRYAWVKLLISCLTAFLSLAVVFTNGIIRVYFTSIQLGIKHRVIGILLGWIPFANIYALVSIILITNKEFNYEYKKEQINEKRKRLKICKTKYPILLVHGVFFRDYKHMNYWGRIPKELETNGAQLYYGNHQSALAVAFSALELTERIKEIIKITGAEKINVIAHSKGGLDTRYAISEYGMDKYIASLTTINSPHRGCLFADYLLKKVPAAVQHTISMSYNKTLKALGDKNPDFMAAVYDLTDKNCNERNEIIKDSPNVYYQSFGSKLNKASGGKFPMNFTYKLAKYFDGSNDGLVSEKSFPWGSRYELITVKGKRGISHADIIDLHRENFEEFDVREFYVNLVTDLKKRGF